MKTSRAGIALIGALSLMTLLGLMIVGAVAATTIAQRTERLSWSSAPLAAAADFALASVVGNPAMYGVADLPFGETRLVVPQSAGAAGAVSVAATRLRGGIIWLVAEARSSSADSAYRRINLLARFATAGPAPSSPATARGPIVFGSGVSIAADTTGDPDCARPAAAPPVQTTDSASLFQLPWQRAALDSAGEGAGVRHVRGDTTLSSGEFAGILIVDGDVTFDGDVQITGLVVASGRIRTIRPGLRLAGAMISAATGPQPAIDVDNAWIRYSPCAVSVVLRRAAALRTVAGRAWSELF